MRKKTVNAKTIPVKMLTAREKKLMAEKAERAEQASKSREVSQALIVSKHERLARALLMLSLTNSKR